MQLSCANVQLASFHFKACRTHACVLLQVQIFVRKVRNKAAGTIGESHHELFASSVHVTTLATVAVL